METPLCDAAAQRAALKRQLHPEPAFDDEGLHSGETDWGALLLAAALLQGPLPPSLLRANERRLYRRSYAFKGAEEEDACRQLTEEPADWAMTAGWCSTTRRRR